MSIKWTIRSLFAVALIWMAYYFSPYWALYQLGRAISETKLIAIESRIDAGAIRRSVARQLTAAYVKETGREKQVASPGDLAVRGGAALLEPLLAPFVSEAGLLALLSGRFSGPAGTQTGASMIRLTSLADAWDIFAETETRGFRKVVFNLPQGSPPERRVGLQMRLSDWRWRVEDVRLSRGVEQQLLLEIKKQYPIL